MNTCQTDSFLFQVMPPEAKVQLNEDRVWLCNEATFKRKTWKFILMFLRVAVYGSFLLNICYLPGR